MNSNPAVPVSAGRFSPGAAQHEKNNVKRAAALLLSLLLLLAAGCSRGVDFRLPSNPRLFSATDYVDPDDPDDSCLSVTWNGRTYIPFGTVRGSLDASRIGPCLGYLVSDTVKDDNVRVFPLKDDAGADYLAVITYRSFMDQTVFWRAVDTAGKDIPVPDFIEPYGYAVWD